MSSKSINDLPDSAFAYIESGGTKDAEGKTTPRSKRHFPIHDAAHVRNALSRAPQSPFGDKAMPKIRAAAKKFGVQMSDSSARAEFLRFYPLEDIHIVRSADGGGDGRVVEAYAAVFDQEAEIQDHEGHYLETIDRAAFNRVIDHIQRSRSGLSAIKVLYNHGMTIGGTPSDRFSLPIGVPVEIRAEQRGLLTRTRYNATPLGEEVLELVRSESITSQSFTGRIVKSDPPLRRGSRRQPAGGELPQVKRMELGLREYGPVLWPAYTGAEILGVRMSTPGSWEPDSNENEGTSTDVEPAADDSLEVDEHSARYHQHALYRMRTEELCKASGITLPRWEQEEADK
jgi:HK97 family phage prohead protease